MEDMYDSYNANYNDIRNEQTKNKKFADNDELEKFMKYKELKKKYLKIKNKVQKGGYSYNNLDTHNQVDTTSGSRAVFDSNGEVIHKQFGGNNPVPLEEFIRSDDFKELIKATKNKVIMTTPLEQYDQIIQLLQQHCKNTRLSAHQIKENIKTLFNQLGEERINYMKINNVVSVIPAGIDWSIYNRNLCEYISSTVVKNLKKEQNLQLGLLMLLVNIKDNDKIDIDNYMKFARLNSDIIKKVKIEAGTVDDEAAINLLRQYKERAEAMSTIYHIRAERVANHLQQAESMASAFASTITTKHGHKCLQPCYEHKGFFGSKSYRCKTDPYKSGLRKKTYDECIINNLATKN